MQAAFKDILAIFILMSFSSCLEKKNDAVDVPPDVEEDAVIISTVSAKLTDGWGWPCIPDIRLYGSYDLLNWTGIEIKLCRQAVELFQYSGGNRSGCLLLEEELPEIIIPRGTVQRRFEYTRLSENPSYTCIIWDGRENCGDISIEIAWVPAWENCQADARRSSVHSTTFGCHPAYDCGWRVDEMLPESVEISMDAADASAETDLDAEQDFTGL